MYLRNRYSGMCRLLGTKGMFSQQEMTPDLKEQTEDRRQPDHRHRASRSPHHLVSTQKLQSAQTQGTVGESRGDICEWEEGRKESDSKLSVEGCNNPNSVTEPLFLCPSGSQESATTPEISGCLYSGPS
jgi:hypothetical protein